MARVKVDYSDKRLMKNVRTFDNRLRAAVAAVTDRRAAETQVWLRRNAPWTDRTGVARQGLFAIANHGKTFEEIFMAYSVTYGIWLEVANDRRFAIISPAIRIHGEALMKDMKFLIERMEGATFSPSPTHGIPKQKDKPGRHSKRNTNPLNGE